MAGDDCWGLDVPSSLTSTHCCNISTHCYCLGYSLRTDLQGGLWWSTSGGVRARYLSPPLSLPSLTVIYRLWASALSEAAVWPQTDDHWLGVKNTSVCWAGHSLLLSLYLPHLSLHIYFIIFPSKYVLFMMRSCLTTRRCFSLGTEADRKWRSRS